MWLPIAISAAAVWMASLIICTAFPHHKADFRGLPDEGAFRQFMQGAGIAPGTYMFPHVKKRADYKSEEFQNAFKHGPIGVLNVWKPGKGMAGNMIATFLVYLVVSMLIAYVGWVALGPSADHKRIFRVLGVAGVLAYCFAFLPNGIWFQVSRRTLTMNVIDGVVYGLITAEIFSWLWPAA
jgi:hypothetical protein